MRRLGGLLALLALQGCGPSTVVIDTVANAFVATVVQSGAMASPVRTPVPTREPEGARVQPDAASVDTIVTGLYASVSHGPEYEPNWDRLRKLFLPGAHVLSPKRPDEEAFTVLDVEQFLERIRKYIAGRRERKEQLGFTEREIGRRQECFGSLCQVLSAYETVRAPRDPAPFARGVHGIQLVYDGQRWSIASLAWDDERPDNPIPPDLLGNEKLSSPSRQ